MKRKHCHSNNYVISISDMYKIILCHVSSYCICIKYRNTKHSIQILVSMFKLISHIENYAQSQSSTSQINISLSESQCILHLSHSQLKHGKLTRHCRFLLLILWQWKIQLCISVCCHYSFQNLPKLCIQPCLEHDTTTFFGSNNNI